MLKFKIKGIKMGTDREYVGKKFKLAYSIFGTIFTITSYNPETKAYRRNNGENTQEDNRSRYSSEEIRNFIRRQEWLMVN